MKKLLLSAMAATALFAVNAAETTLEVKNATNIKGEFTEQTNKEDGSVQAYAHYQPCEGFEIDGYTFTMSTTSENANQAPAYYYGKDDANTVRLYFGSIITVKAPSAFKTFTLSAKSIAGIDAANNLTASAGTVSYNADDKTITWTGDATSELTLTVPSAKGADTKNPNIQITSFIVSTDGSDPVDPPTPPTPGEHIYSALLDTAETCDWTFENVTMPEELSYIWSWKSYQNAYYLNASAYLSGVAYATEAYAVSPVVDLTGVTGATCTWESAARFQTTLRDLCKFCVREEGATEWTEVAIPAWPEAGAWTWASCGTVDLSAWAGKKVNFAFKYGSTATGADTWEIRNFYVDAAGAAVEGIEADNVEARWFDLSGRAVSNPEAGLYIMVRGAKATKVLVK